MAKFDIGALTNGLEKVLAGVQSITPLASALGIVAPVSTVIISAVSIATNVLERAKEAKSVITSQDERKITAILIELQTVNDKLAKAVEAS